MRQAHRLRPLQMCVAWEDNLLLALGQFDQRLLQRAKLLEQTGDFIQQPQPKIQRHLVVPRAAGVELRARRHPPGQLRLDVHVHILELRSPPKLPGADFPCDGIQPAVDGPPLGRAQHPNFAKHRRLRPRAADVMTPQPPVERERLREARHVGRRRGGEASAAG